MKLTIRALTAICLLAGSFPAAAENNNEPVGSVVELHSCEVFAGGCIASSQSTLGGRSLLRVWSFEKGSFAGQDLAGLKVALLQVAKANLAYKETRPTRSVVYLPETARKEQQSALVAWVKFSEGSLLDGALEEKVSPIEYVRNGDSLSIKVGSEVFLETEDRKTRDLASCGGALWYSPRSRTDTFKVLRNRNSSVRENDLALLWKDHGASSVFLGHFGVSPADAGAKIYREAAMERL